MNPTEKALFKICNYLNNWFWRSKIKGKFTINDGKLIVDGLKEGQYYRIVNSTFNDGIHIYPTEDLNDEEFEGEIWSMVIPEDIIDLASDLILWEEKYGGIDSVNMSPYSSESFNGYSYSKNVGSSDGGIGSNSWESAFASILRPYRRTRGAT